MERIFCLLEEYSMLNIVLLVGLLYLSWTVVWLVRSLWSCIKAFALSDLVRVKLQSSSYGWAVVTGASDGIGKEYAIQLAKCGINVVLMSNAMDELKSVEKKILDQYNVSVKIIFVDFSSSAEIYDKIKTELSGLEIGILINNVGVSYEIPDYFLNVPVDRLWSMIKVNVATVVMMTKMILPDMLDKKRGIIVNVSSTSAICPAPLLCIYGATKIFIDYFTVALQNEYSGKGVIIQSILPGFVATKMSGITRDNFIVPSPRKFVQDALATIGIQSRTFGTLSHALQVGLFSLLPSWLMIQSTHYILGIFKRSMSKNQKKQ